MDNKKNTIKVVDLGLSAYSDVLVYQEELVKKSLLDKELDVPTQNTLIFCEHLHTLTLGKHAKKENLLYQVEYLNSKGINIYNIDRGGDVTYHGPGQLVAYPIFDLENFKIGLRQYIYNLEEVMIRFLLGYNINAERDTRATGVWIKEENSLSKIGAIGVKCSRFITMHGFALNINTDLSFFDLINPCGFTDRRTSSIEKEIGYKIDMQIVKNQITDIFNDVFISDFK